MSPAGSRILEHDGKALLRAHGVAVPRGTAATTPAAAAAAARELGGAVVVKALVPANRRAHAGGVRFASDPGAAGAAAAELLGSSLAGADVASVLVEEHIEIERELYLAFLVDRGLGLPVALASLRGGVDIEEAGASDAGAIRTLALDPWGRGSSHLLRGLWAGLGLSGRDLLAVAELSERAARVFFAAELELLELNPIALVAGTAGRAVAVGALLAADDLALARHPGLAAIGVAGSARPPTALEQQALAAAARDPYRGTARFIELAGEIGLLVGGGGGSLVLFEAVRRAGGSPACYTEIGGNPSAEKVRDLTRVVLSVPGVAGLLVGHNITNNTQVDLVAEGVVAALADLGLDARAFPVVAREIGTHDERGRAIFEAAGIECLGEDATLDDAARRIVERVGQARAVVS
jgi:succinyl-CoA synthetase beta subunit